MVYYGEKEDYDKTNYSCLVINKLHKPKKLVLG